MISPVLESSQEEHLHSVVELDDNNDTITANNGKCVCIHIARY